MSTEACYFCEREAFLCTCNEKIVPFQTPPSRARQPEKPPKAYSLGPSDVEVVGFLSKKDDMDYWINDPGDIAKLFAFIKANKIKIMAGHHDHDQ